MPASVRVCRRRQNCSWDAEVDKKVLVAPHAVERVADDEQGPPLAEDLQRAGYPGASIVIEVTPSQLRRELQPERLCYLRSESSPISVTDTMTDPLSARCK
jgi:hypothetical protein